MQSAAGAHHVVCLAAAGAHHVICLKVTSPEQFTKSQFFIYLENVS